MAGYPGIRYDFKLAAVVSVSISTTGGRVEAIKKPLIGGPVSCDNPALMFPYLCNNNQNLAPV
jgi:hypothetical protein